MAISACEFQQIPSNRSILVLLLLLSSPKFGVWEKIRCTFDLANRYRRFLNCIFIDSLSPADSPSISPRPKRFESIFFAGGKRIFSKLRSNTLAPLFPSSPKSISLLVRKCGILRISLRTSLRTIFLLEAAYSESSSWNPHSHLQV